MTTRVLDELITLESGLTLGAKLGEIVSATDYGALPSGTAAANTTAINAAIQAAATAGGYVIVPFGVSYTEASIVFDTDVTLIVFGANGIVTFLCSDFGDTQIAKSGIAIKQQGVSGVLLRGVDFGVSAEPFLQVVDLANGDLAALHSKFIEMDEMAAPANPSANKSRLYTRDNGSGKTQLVVQFPTGAVQVISTEP